MNIKKARQIIQEKSGQYICSLYGTMTSLVTQNMRLNYKTAVIAVIFLKFGFEKNFKN